MSKDNKGITVKKENFSEWYTQVIQRADLADYSAVSGCIVFKPASYALWENIQRAVDIRLKEMGVRNAYFPLFIPERLLQKETAHVEGFTPEVAWVTHAGNSELKERLAIRPTSETIIYDSYSRWIQSYNDLPLRLNMWNNVIRWEFEHPVPFLRTREFLWNEGHTCFATKEEAEKEVLEILSMYENVLKEYLALPGLPGKKSDKEKFAGAVYTTSIELSLPNGKAIQGPDAHFDGQNFAKAFNITFLDDKGKHQHVWQNTWAITTRMLGILIAIHGDDKGLIMPPRITPLQVVIVPILFEDSKKTVLKKSKDLEKQLKSKNILVHLDDRENYSAGWKFNEWEVKGVPIRLEIGPKDIEKKQVVLVRRDNGEKSVLSLDKTDKEITKTLDLIHNALYKRAKKQLDESIVTVETFKDAQKQIENKKILFAPWCNKTKCETLFKEKTGAKSLNSPFEQPSVKGKKCFICGDKANVWFYFGKSY